MEKQKILVVAGGLQIGGAERVAANISKYAPEGEFEFHYLVFDCNENVYGSEIEERGGKVFTFPLPNKGYISYISRLYRLMREHRYTAVHSHTMFNSGINLVVAKICRVPVRIAHSHTTKTETPVSVPQKIYEFLMRIMIARYSTHCYACGVDAGKWLFGKKVFEQRGRVVRNGIDTNAFKWSEENRDVIRERYSLTDAFVIGHTGTLVKVKNQRFLIELMPEILEKKPNAVLMLLGGNEGQELENLQAIAQLLGVAERVIFCGPVQNVNEYLSAFDVFVFPSTREGTPLALLEAQANGIPCVVSENVPSDAFLTKLVKTLPLSDPSLWVDAVCATERQNSGDYYGVVMKCGYDSQEAYGQIYNTYLGKKMGQTMVSLSFDDGRGDNTRILDEVLLPNHIPATLNITTGYVDGTCAVDQCPSNKRPMRKEDVIRLGRHPLVEVALHGDRHKNTVEDIYACKKKLVEWLDLDESYRFGFASPESKLKLEEWRSSEFSELRNELLYMRDSFRISSYHAVRTFARKLGRVIRLPLFYRVAYEDTAMAYIEEKLVYSACVHKDTTVKQVRALLDDCMKNGTSITLVFHSVLDDCTEEDTWSWERGKFEELCSYLAAKRDEGKLDICTTKKMMERLP